MKFGRISAPNDDLMVNGIAPDFVGPYLDDEHDCPPLGDGRRLTVEWAGLLRLGARKEERDGRRCDGREPVRAHAYA
jgi:hypothetical protein